MAAGVLKGEDDLVEGAAPDLTVSSKCRLLVEVNEAGTEGLLRESLKRFFWSLCHRSLWRVHHTGLSWAGDAPHHHSGDLPCPSEQ